MATITIKNIPEKLVKRLKARAVRHRRSLNHEIIASLETVGQATPIDSEALLAKVRRVRQAPRTLRLTDQKLAQLKTVGRS